VRRCHVTGDDVDFARGAEEDAHAQAAPSLGGKSSGKYREAPMLAARVAAGKLPPVEKRLPAVPFVRNVAQIGRYGGTLYDQAESPGGRFHLDGTLIVAAQETTRTTRRRPLPDAPTIRAAHIARKSARTRNRLCAPSPPNTRSRATSICTCKAPKEKPYARTWRQLTLAGCARAHRSDLHR